MNKTNSNKVEIQIFGDVSLNGLFCDPQYHKDLQVSLQNLDVQIGPADLRIVNWEAPITKEGKFNPNKKPAIATTPKTAQIFCDAFPIDVATLGNNHIGDCLSEGLETTLSFFEARNTKTIGAAKTLQAVQTAEIIDIKGVSIGVLNFLGKETNPKIPEEYNIFVNDINQSSMLTQIKNWSSKVEHLFVILHWGIEYVQYPSFNQRKLAKQCIDAGASVIIGHHSHCLQGVEEYKNKLIFYSLGNFIFSGLKGRENFGWPSFCNRGGMYKIYLNKNEKINYEFMPFKTSNKGIEILDVRKSIKLQEKLTKNLRKSNFLYKIIRINNVAINWFFRLPLFLVKTKGGIIQGAMSYLKIKYFRLFLSYFFPK